MKPLRQARYRWFSYALLVAVGVAVLVLFLQNRSVDIELHGRRMQTLTELRRLDTQLDRDVLKASYFILEQFDPLVVTAAQLRELVAAMRAPATGFAVGTDPVVQRALEEALVVVDEKLRALERIKSLAALLRNSLQYLPLAVADVHRSDPHLGYRLTRLSNQLYLYFLFPGGQDVAALQAELEALDRAAHGASSSALLSSTLTHLRADMGRLAVLADLRQRYSGLPSEERAAQLFTAYSRFYEERDRRSSIGSMLLLAITLLLFVLLGLGLRRLGHAHEETDKAWRNLRDAVESLSEAFALFDRRQRLVLHNQKYLDFYPWLKGRLRPGMPLDEVLALNRASGMLVAASADGGRDVQPTLQDTHSYQQELATGLCYLASDSRCSDGGIACVRVDITERRQAEEMLRKLSTAVEHSSASVVITDLEGSIEYVNPRFTEVTGYGSAEAIGQNPRILRSEQTPRQVYEALWGRLTRGQAWTGEIRNKRKNGEHYWEETHVAPVKNGAGQATHYVAIKTEITARKQYEEALTKSEARFRDLFEKNSSVMLLIDPCSGVVVDANASALHFYGYPREQLIGMSMRAINTLPPERLAEELQLAMSQQRNCFNFRHRLASGDIRDVEVHSTPIESDGKALLFSILHDTTVRQELERRLRDSEELHRTLFLTMAEGVMVVDRAGELLAFNDAALKICQISAAQLAHHQTRYVQPDGSPLPLALYPALRAGRGERLENEVHEVIRGDGRHAWHSTSSRPLQRKDEAEPYAAVVSFSVITGLVEAERSLQLAQSVFESASEGIIVTDAAHQFLAVNPAFSRITGYPPVEVIGRDLAVLAAGEKGCAIFQAIGPRMLQDGYWEGEVESCRKEGGPFVAWLKIAVVAGHASQPRRHVVLISDVTERKLKADALWRQANFDPLTGLPNRKLLEDRLQRAIAQAHRKGTEVGLLFIDLDRFKPVNDQYGHAVGDELLCQVARRLASSLREDDTLARLGGDEFVALLLDLPRSDAPRQTAEKLVSVLAEAFFVGDLRLEISCSVGIARFPHDARSAEALIGAADAAMYRAKEGGRGDWRE